MAEAMLKGFDVSHRAIRSSLDAATTEVVSLKQPRTYQPFIGRTNKQRSRLSSTLVASFPKRAKRRRRPGRQLERFSVRRRCHLPISPPSSSPS
ncbi:MlaD domain-containing protein [Psidium guajava]|nr:MlaD domain-containing protein [Psidium guajava]